MSRRFIPTILGKRQIISRKQVTAHLLIFDGRPWTEELGGLQSMGLQELVTT